MNHISSAAKPAVPAIQTPESLMVASIRESDHSAACELLRGAGLPIPFNPERPGRLPDWSDSLAQHPQAHLLLLVPSPVVAVAWSLNEGKAPKAALADWLATARAVLDLIRLQRRRTSLVFAEPALTAPKAFLQKLAERLQVSLHPAATGTKPPELPSAALRMIAGNAIWLSPDARNAAAELEANALPLDAGDLRPAVVIDQFFNEYQGAIEAGARYREQMREENGLLLSQLHQLQEELESQFLHVRTVEKQLADATRQKDDIERAHQELAAAKQQQEQLRKQLEATLQNHEAERQAVEDLQEENELLLHQLRHAREELEHYYQQSTQISGKEMEELQRRLQAAEDTVQALYNSKSWKITKPLRWMLDLFSGGGKAR